MIKKTILTLGIITMSFIGFSYGAGKLQEIGLESQPSAISNNYDITFLKGGGLLTNYVGSSKSILALRENVLFRWTPDGLPYAYLQPNDTWIGIRQGYFDRYYLCDPLTGNQNVGCEQGGTISASGDNNFAKQTFKNFFTNVVPGDYALYQYDEERYNGATRNYTVNKILVCFSSETIGKSLCFYGGACTNGKNCDMNGIQLGGLINSLGYTNLTFGTLPRSDISYAPGQGGYMGAWDNTNDNTTNVTLGSCPTIGQILKTNYSSNYNTGLCYNNTLYFNGTSMETIDKQDIFTIFDNNYENYTNRTSIYRNNCTNANTTQACQTAFSGEYKKYSIIANANNNDAETKRLRNYCNLALNYDPNTTTCVASGYIAEEPTEEEKLNDIINMNTGIPTPGQATNGQDNNVFNALCDPNNPENCYGTGSVRDIFGSLQRIYGKITGLFTQRNGVNGIIPDYILWITFLTILFTIIFKK